MMVTEDSTGMVVAPEEVDIRIKTDQNYLKLQSSIIEISLKTYFNSITFTKLLTT